MIDEFKGKWEDFSNFSHAKFWFGGFEWNNTETPFQAWKSVDPEMRAWVRAAGSPREAKRRGRKIQLRTDWNEICRPLMLILCRRKFMNQGRAGLLLSTGQETLIEGNTWGDDRWGAILCEHSMPGTLRDGTPVTDEHIWRRDENSVWVGRNWLGITLMQLRTELQLEKPW
jgi:ribA/ribD-fused uncharacterized protein